MTAVPAPSSSATRPKPSSSVAVLLGAILATPFFVKLTGSTIQLGDPVVAVGSGQTLPIGIFAVALFLGVSALKSILKNKIQWKRSPLNGPMILLVFLNLLIFLVGLLYESRVENFLFFLQTIAPLACFFVALNSLRSVEDVKSIFVVCVWIVGSLVLCLMVVTTTAIGLGATTETYEFMFRFPIYQLFDYVPLVVAIVYGMGVSLLLGKVPLKAKWTLFCLVTSMLASIFFLRSRGALATLLVITLIQIVLFARGRGSARQLVMFSVAVVAVIGGMVLGPASLTLENTRALLEGGAGEQSLVERLLNMSLAIDTILHNPLIGQAYVTVENILDQRVVANPHNQYLTYAVRGGVLSLLLYLWILVLFLRRLFRLRKSGSTPLVKVLSTALLSVFLGVALVSNMLQDNFTQPYSGFLLFFLMGVGEFLCSQSSVVGEREGSSLQERPRRGD